MTHPVESTIFIKIIGLNSNTKGIGICIGKEDSVTPVKLKIQFIWSVSHTKTVNGDTPLIVFKVI
jgi:hypothetical protein